MKVRVIKEMPFAKVGDVLEKSKNFKSNYKQGHCHTFDVASVMEMIEGGWLEEVKEESLDYRFKELLGGGHCFSPDTMELCSCMAKQHYLDALDRTREKWMQRDMSKSHNFNQYEYLRKGLEEA